MRLRRSVLVWVSTLLLLVPAQAAAADRYSAAIARGDAHWSSRAEGEGDGRAVDGPIRGALQAYEDALGSRPAALEAYWKLLRALHFAGEFTQSEPDEGQVFFERAIEVSKQGRRTLVELTESRTAPDTMSTQELVEFIDKASVSEVDVARFYFWSAINWGAWSRGAGLLAAVRQGVANRLHRYVRVTIRLEPDYDEGGAFRLLGRLHAELPRVPFLSSWVDRDEALPLIERAYGIAPANPGNRLLLALTLLDFAPERRTSAVDLLRQVATLSPRPTMWIEDIRMRRAARTQLERIGYETAESRP